MRKAGYCMVCGRNVFLGESGECLNGHPVNCVTGVYDADGTDIPVDGVASSPRLTLTSERPRSVPVLPIAALLAVALGLLVICGVILGLTGDCLPCIC